MAPGESTTLTIAWTSHVPRTFARTGVIGDFYFLGQWFPKIGVLEDTGWNCHQFHAATEFFSDFGSYDVQLTVPTGWTVGATGTEQGRRDAGNGLTTHHYHAADVHDFAWTTSPDYLERTATFTHPTLPPVVMRLLLQPEHASQADRHFAAARATLRYYGEWFGPYPYAHITIVDPAWQSGADGMEYPTLFTAGTRWLAPVGQVTSPRKSRSTRPGTSSGTASSPTTSSSTPGWTRASTRSRPRGRWRRARRRTVLREALFRRLHPVDVARRPAAHAGGRDGLAGYRRRAARRYAVDTDVPLLARDRRARHLQQDRALAGHARAHGRLGRRCSGSCRHTSRDSTFEHPKPADFFAIVNEVSGRDFTWFFDRVYRSSVAFDYAVDVFTSQPVTSTRRQPHVPHAGRGPPQ